MGLDIYAGTLTRYYSHNWKTIFYKGIMPSETGFRFSSGL